MNKILKRLLLVITVLAVLAVMLISLPYYITKPGTTEKLGELVKVEGKADNKNGSFSLTTIGLQHATALTLTQSPTVLCTMLNTRLRKQPV